MMKLEPIDFKYKQVNRHKNRLQKRTETEKKSIQSCLKVKVFFEMHYFFRKEPTVNKILLGCTEVIAAVIVTEFKEKNGDKDHRSSTIFTRFLPTDF